MALEQATFINQLVSFNPQATDTVAQADDHIRLIKSTIKATFPNITGPVTRTQDQLNNPLPAGVIVMWSGSLATIPAGWFLCDGANGTPNLRDRFVVGAGSTYAVGNAGGAATVTLSEAQIPNHNHVITATADSAGTHTHSISDPGHAHAYNQASGQAAESGTGFVGYSGFDSLSSTTSAAAATGISITSAGAHTHTITATSATTGGGQAHENRPPYYALAYIMKS